jgi:hypothetical protein
MRHLSILLWRIVTSLLVVELQGEPILSALAPRNWEEIDSRYRADEEAHANWILLQTGTTVAMAVAWNA